MVRISTAIGIVADGAEHVTAGDCRCRRCHQNRPIIKFARRRSNGSISDLEICQRLLLATPAAPCPS
jgi:hypothetical protein